MRKYATMQQGVFLTTFKKFKLCKLAKVTMKIF